MAEEGRNTVRFLLYMLPSEEQELREYIEKLPPRRRNRSDIIRRAIREMIGRSTPKK